MSSVPVALIRELSQKIADDFLTDQKIIMLNVDKLVVILRQPQAQKSYQDEQKDADRYQSNTASSQFRREDLYRAQMIKSLQEKKLAQTSFRHFLEMQKEFLALKDRAEQQREATEKKNQAQQMNLLNENEKKKLAQLLSDIEKLSKEIKSLIDLLFKTIEQLTSAIRDDNIRFIANYEKVVRSNLEVIGERKEDGFYVLIGDKEVKMNMDEIIKIFTKVNEGAFNDIIEGKPVDIALLRTEALMNVRAHVEYLDKMDGGVSSNQADLVTLVNEIMNVWDKQASVLMNHIAIQVERQSEIVCLNEMKENFQAMANHINDVKDELTEMPDIFKDKGFDNVSECIAGVQLVTESIDVNLLERGGSRLVAVENIVMKEQSKLELHPELQNQPSPENQITVKNSGGS